MKTSMASMAAPQNGPKISFPSETDLANLSKDERLAQAAQVSQAASTAQSLVSSLRSKAAILTNPKERERALQEAYAHELEARGLTKKARILESGTFQGAAGGVGIGAATAAGLGTVVGTLVGGVVSVPTTLVGGLVGAGTGLAHGPWIKLRPEKKDPKDGGGGEGEGGEGEEKMVQLPPEAVERGDVKVDEASGQVTVLNPDVLKTALAASQVGVGGGDGGAGNGGGQKKNEQNTTRSGEKRKPKKLEVRSNKPNTNTKPGDQKPYPPTPGSQAKTTTTTTTTARRKPPKLEVRSKKAE